MKLYTSCYTYKRVFSVYGVDCLHVCTHILTHTITYTHTHSAALLSDCCIVMLSPSFLPQDANWQWVSGEKHCPFPPRGWLHFALMSWCPKVRLRNSTWESHRAPLPDFPIAGRGSLAPPRPTLSWIVTDLLPKPAVLSFSVIKYFRGQLISKKDTWFAKNFSLCLPYPCNPSLLTIRISG